MVEGYHLVLDNGFEMIGLLRAAKNEEHGKAVVASEELSMLKGGAIQRFC